MKDLDIPSPALTPSQRLHLDIYGYVIIENTLSPQRVTELRDVIYEIEELYKKTGEYPMGLKPNKHGSLANLKLGLRIDNLPHVHPAFLKYLTDPYLVGVAREAIGTHIRLMQSDAHVVRYPPEIQEENKNYKLAGFHHGWHAGFNHTMAGLYHCPFVKTLTNLTDLGPDDGGTAVIPGSHKLAGIEIDDVIRTALQDPARLIRQVCAPAGSTLLFYESLLHGAGLCRSGRERVFIVGGYHASMFQAHQEYQPDEEFIKTIDEACLPVLTGSRGFQTERIVRSISENGSLHA